MPERTRGLKVAVCICTSGRRAESLDRLLDALGRQAPVAGDHVVRVVVVVADNTTTGACRPQIEQRFDADLVYCHEPHRGVSHARNASVEAALAADPDFLAFIDDDEEPDPGWLAALIAAAQSFDAPIVAGPVFERCELPGPTQATSKPTGTLLDYGFTGNLLISRPALLSLTRTPQHTGGDPTGWPFDHRFDRTGGEDVHLTRRLRAVGHRIVWCNEAIAYTDIGPADVTSRRVAIRAFHGALNAERARRTIEGRSLRRIPLGVAVAARGTAFLALDLVCRRSTRKSLERLAAGFGVMVGAAGVPVRGDWWAA